MKKHTISLCMIVKNEEKYLDKCLESVRNRVDEIIVVDTGSTDNTLEIAENNGAKTFFFKWNDDFAIARNFSIKQATMEYILVMDADEFLDENVNFQKVLSTDKDHYTIRIKNELTSGGAILHPAVRLFKNHVGLRYFGKIHEHLNIEDKSLNLSHEFGDVLLHHIGYTAEVVKAKNKHSRNLKILLEEVKQNTTGYNLYNLGNQYKLNNQYSEALDEYKKAFPLSKERLFINHLLFNMIDCLRILGKSQEALNVVNASIESFPNHTDFHFIQGRIYEEMSYFKDAEKAYKKCIELGEVKFFQTLEGVGSFLSYVRLGNIYLEMGENLNAFEMAIEALKSNKYHMPALRMYLEILIRTKVPTENIQENLTSVFPITNINDLKHLIIVLAVIKSPLLQTYLDLYKLNVSNSVLAISKQYSKNYQGAYDIWEQIEVEKNEYFDVLLLSFLLQENNLMYKYRFLSNLSDKELKLLDKLIFRKEVEIVKVTKEFEEIILFIAEQLIQLGEDNEFNYLFNIIANSAGTIKGNFSEMMLKNGFSKNAQDLLIAFYTDNQSNKQYVEILADTCFKQNQFNEALAFYTRAIQLKSDDYMLYEKLYRTYEKLNDQQGLMMVQKEIKRLFPLASWVK